VRELFHIVRNHPFVDGNERTGLIAALAFLGLNGLTVRAAPEALFEMVMGAAAGSRSKAEIAVFLQAHSAPR